MKFQVKLIKLLGEKDMSQRELARKTNLPYTTINSICATQKNKTITLRSILRISRALNMTIYELIEGTDYEEKEENANL